MISLEITYTRNVYLAKIYEVVIIELSHYIHSLTSPL